MTRSLLAAAACSMLLAGCGGSPDETAAADASADRPAVPIASTAAGVPKRAAGRWQLRTMGEGGTVLGTQYLCVDDASEERASIADQIAKNVGCAKYDFRPADAGWTFDFVCGPAGMTVATRGRVAGDFTTAYRIEMTEEDATISVSRIVEAKRTGPCPQGMKPGTLTDEAGGNVTDITN